MPFDATLTIRTIRKPGYLGRVATAIGSAGALISDIQTLRIGRNFVVRDLTIEVLDDDHLRRVLARFEDDEMHGVASLVGVTDRTYERHHEGKLEVRSRIPIRSLADLRQVYTPGVARVCERIKAEPSRVRSLTGVGRTVAVVTNGTAVLGLGDIGVQAALPVMEGTAALYAELVGISAVPVLVDSADAGEIVTTVERIAKGFGAIHLEEIASPVCFEVEDALRERLPIPVLHDNQHGTAVVVLAALLNALTHTKISLGDVVVGQIGLGAAGQGIARLIAGHGVRELLGADRSAPALKRFARLGGQAATLDEVMARADVVISTTGVPGLIRPEQVREGQVILALSTPVPEIEADLALQRGAAFAVDGRVVNNVLGFPGLFKGALDARAAAFTDAMLLAAAREIASAAPAGELVPDPLELEVHRSVAKAVAAAARGAPRAGW